MEARHARLELERLLAALAVDPRALELGLRQPELLALAVDAQQRGHDVRQQAQGRGLIVDEDAVAAGAADLAAHHQLAAAASRPASSSAAMTVSSAPSNVPVTVSVSASVRMRSADARAPVSSASESTTIDLPAPVSPVSTFQPGENSTLASERTARFLMWR